ncbi:hypothetical protein GQR58_026950 [Nymphon striatum]|nr:hypothetical protein GQR58_026950 [Nymphon striatum]
MELEYLEKKKYSELQALAKNIGIKANMKAEKLILAILSAEPQKTTEQNLHKVEKCQEQSNVSEDQLVSKSDVDSNKRGRKKKRTLEFECSSQKTPEVTKHKQFNEEQKQSDSKSVEKSKNQNNKRGRKKKGTDEMECSSEETTNDQQMQSETKSAEKTKNRSSKRGSNRSGTLETESLTQKISATTDQKEQSVSKSAEKKLDQNTTRRKSKRGTYELECSSLELPDGEISDEPKEESRLNITFEKSDSSSEENKKDEENAGKEDKKKSSLYSKTEFKKFSFAPQNIGSARKDSPKVASGIMSKMKGKTEANNNLNGSKIPKMRNKGGISKVKTPNFSRIHQKQFDQMESLPDYVQKKQKLKEETTVKKFTPLVIRKNLSVNFNGANNSMSGKTFQKTPAPSAKALRLRSSVKYASPNFAKIHQKQFDQMESLTDYVQKKQNLKEETSAKKFTPLKIRKNVSVSFKDASNSISSKKFQKTPAPKELKPPTFKFESVLRDSWNKPVVTPATSKESNISGKFKLKESKLPKPTLQEKHMKLKNISTETEKVSQIRKHRREFVKGVRTNKRFELQMKMRMKN